MTRKRILTALLVLCLMLAVLAVPAAAAEADPQAVADRLAAAGEIAPLASDTVIAAGTVDVNETLNVRSGPGTGYSKVGTLNGGQRVGFYEITNGWGRTDYGWISMSYVILDEDLVFTDAGYCGTGEDVLWGYAAEAKLLVIVGEGPMLDYPAVASTEYLHPWVWYGAEIRTVVVNTGITYIGDYTFNDCTGLRYAYIADTVTGMGDATFKDCTSLLETAIPESVASIGSSTFEGCANLEYVTLPSGLTQIGIRMFRGCAKLEVAAFPADVTVIDALAFADCTGLAEIILPEGLTTIGEGAFENCHGLNHVDFPGSLTTLERNAFDNCTGLESMKFYGSAPRFGDAFHGVTADVYYPANNFTWTEAVRQDYGGTLTWHAVSIPGSEDPTFSGTCGDDLTWTLADGVLTISGTGGMDSYSSDWSGAAPWHLYSGAITQVILPQGLTSIGDNAFREMQGLTAISIPEGVTVIGSYAFHDTGLTAIDIPGSVTKIGSGAFAYCAGLKEITFRGDAPTITGDAFRNVEATAYYPADRLTWDAETMLDYCGTLTWEPYGEPAFGGTCGAEGDNLTWVLAGDGTLTISGQNGMEDYGLPMGWYTDAPWYQYRSRVTRVVLEEGVTTIGDYAFYGLEALTEVRLPESLTQIGNCAFGQCQSLREITLPAATVLIGNDVFYLSDSLEAIWVAEGNPNYASDERGVLFNKDKTALLICPSGFRGDYAVPDGVTRIGEKAFACCEKLTGLEIPAGVEAIERFAFQNCSGLEEVRFLGDAPEMGIAVFMNTVTTARYPAGNATWTSDVLVDHDGEVTWIPYATGEVIASGWSGYTTWTLTEDGVMTVSGTGAMKNYPGKTAMPWYDYRDQIVAVFIEDGVTAIGDYAFYGMSALRAVVIPDTVTTIGHYAFKNSTALDGVVLPAKLTQLGESAFYGCTGLTAIEIPASLWTVKPYTFKNCTGLETVTFREGNLQKIGDGAFYNTGLWSLQLPECLDILDVYAFKNCANLWNIHLPSGLTEIREAVFYGTAVEDLTIPEGITQIDGYAFKKCAALRSVSLPETLVTIGESAFMDCPSLTEVNIPEGVSAIGGYAFKRCTALSAMTLPGSLTSLGGSALHTCTALTALTIPADTQIIGEYCFSASGLENVAFTGDAPAIGTGAFNKVTATVTYPGGNTTWTADVMQQYGGTLTWVAAE